MTWIIWKVNRIPMHYGVAYKSVYSLARDHVIRYHLTKIENRLAHRSGKLYVLC